MKHTYSVFNEGQRHYDYYSSSQKPALYLRSNDSRLHSFTLVQDLRVPLPEDARYVGSGAFAKGAVATSGTEPLFFNGANFATTIVNFTIISAIVGWIHSLFKR